MTVEKIERYVGINVHGLRHGAEAMRTALDAQLHEQNMDHVVPERIMCFAACNLRPNVVIPLARCWSSGVTKADAGAVVGFLKSEQDEGRQDVARFQKNNDPQINTMIFEMTDVGLLDKGSAN
jgi:(2Fe-2S) ferredoxin